jgi:thiosulfate/3-mercaptopyruvate sulfurtransferase
VTTWRTLIPREALAEKLGAADWVIVDTRFELTAPDAGRRAYAAGHIPGAVYAHLDEDLAGPVTAHSGRHPLPDADTLAAKLGAWGVDRSTQLVAYDDSGGAYAARLWWLARWLGHDAVAVLDGGWSRWRALGLAEETGEPSPRARSFEAHPRPNLAIDVDALVEALASSDVLLLDARGSSRFRGEAEPIDARAGHVPGARNHPFQENLGSDGRFLDTRTLRERYAGRLGGRAPRDVVCMCGSGVTACHDLLAMAHAGMPGARLYVGSWSEWIRDPRRPIALGPQ